MWSRPEENPNSLDRESGSDSDSGKVLLYRFLNYFIIIFYYFHYDFLICYQVKIKSIDHHHEPILSKLRNIRAPLTRYFIRYKSYSSALSYFVYFSFHFCVSTRLSTYEIKWRVPCTLACSWNFWWWLLHCSAVLKGRTSANREKTRFTLLKYSVSNTF